MENTTPESNSVPQESKSYINVKLKKPKPLTIAIGAVVILILIAVFFAKGLFVAATVNGSPISRLSVIKELEKEGGKQVLESLIDKKLIQMELDKQKISVTKEEIDQEVKKIEAQVAVQGGTLASILTSQGLTEEKFREQLILQKKLEKVLADKIAVSDAEVDAYITSNKATPPKDVKMGDFKEQIREQLKGQEFQGEAQQWVASLTQAAKIKYYVTY